LTNQPGVSGQKLNIDYATIRQAPPQPWVVVLAIKRMLTNLFQERILVSHPMHILCTWPTWIYRLSGGVIAGIVVAAFAIVSLVFVILYLLRRLKSNSTRPKDVDSLSTMAYHIEPLPLPETDNMRNMSYVSTYQPPTQLTQHSHEPASISVTSEYSSSSGRHGGGASNLTMRISIRRQYLNQGNVRFATGSADHTTPSESTFQTTTPGPVSSVHAFCSVDAKFKYAGFRWPAPTRS
jgi:hypothetical protein